MSSSSHDAMLPQGSGAGQAIEDAYVLGSLLAHPATTLRTLPIALKVYELVRLPHANEVMRRSATNGRLYEFADPRFACVASEPDGSSKEIRERDTLSLRGIGQAIRECSSWRWETDVEDDRMRAVQLLEEWVQQG